MVIPSLDDGYYDNATGFAMIKKIRLDIGGYGFETHNAISLYSWAQLSTPVGKHLGSSVLWGSLIERQQWATTTGSNSLYEGAAAGQPLHVPIYFWFCRHYALALPVIALQYHDIEISVDFEKSTNISHSNANITTPANKAANAVNFNSRLLCNYIFLDTVERRLFAAGTHEYLFDQTNFPDGPFGVVVSPSNVGYKPVVNHPTKEFIWAFRKVSNTPQSIETFDFSGGINNATGGSFDTFQTLEMFLNGNVRLSRRDAVYFRDIVPREVHTTVPYNPPIVLTSVVGPPSQTQLVQVPCQIYNYSFCLFPEKWQPSGSCNFSRLDSVLLNFGGVGGDGSTYTLFFMYKAYNIITIVGGMAGLNYSS